MAQTYTRQSSIADGDTITAALFNNEYNQLLNAFSYSSSSASSTGHRHDGTAGQGGNVHTIGDLDFLNKIVVDSTNNRWGVFVEVSSAAVEQIRIQDGAIVPVTDNDIDLGTSSLEFKDGYFDGTVYADAINFNGTAISSTAAELNILDGVTSTASELNIMDGDTSATSTTLADADRVVVNDGGTMKQVALTDFETYFESSIDTIANFEVTTELQTPLIAFTDGDDAIQIADGGGVTMVAGLTSTASANSLGATSFNDADITNVGDIQLDSITGDGDTNTSITFSGSDVITIAAGGDNQVTFTNGAIVPSTDNDIDLGTSSTEFKDAYFDGTVTTDALVADTADINGGTVDGAIIGGASAAAITGTAITGTSFVIGSADINEAELETIDGVTAGTVAASKAVVVDSNKDIGSFRNITLTGELDAATLDISGDADIDGTLEADAITIGGVTLAETISDTVGAMVTSNTESGITVAYQDADNTLDFTIGTLNQDTTGTAAVATTVTITDNESTNENNAIVFTSGGDLDGGNLGLESDGDLKYNPSTGTLSATNISVSGTFSTVNSVTMNANNAVVFEGSTADAHETTLSSIDATGDRTINLPNVSGTLPVLAAASATQISSTPEELNILDGATVVVGEINALDLGSTAVGTAIASKAVILDSNKDYTGIRNLTITGELDGATLDISGDADIDGTTNLDVVDIDGAVDMATTLAVAGNVDFNGDLDVDGTTNLDVVDIDGAVDMASTLAVTGIVTLTDDLIIGDGKTIGSASDVDAMTIASNGQVTFTQTLIGTALDISGDADIDGTLETDALTINGSALNYKAFGTSSIMLGDNATGTIDAANYNTGVGVDVFAALTSGDNNTAVGFAALDANTTASFNVAVGTEALTANTTGEQNVAVGHEALEANTTAEGNVGIGMRALQANTTGASNTAVGQQALLNNTTASNNSAFGKNTLVANTTGHSNVAVGKEALTANTTANFNVAVGVEALEANTTGSENTAMGIHAMKANTTGSTNVGIGTSALDANTTGSNNTAVGGSALGANTTASNNTAVGQIALSANTTGANNVAVGMNCLNANTTGANNVSVGVSSLGLNTTGTRNVSIGDSALYNNTVSDNTACGFQALTANTTGAQSTAVGKDAGVAITTGSGHTAIGFSALKAATTIDYGFALGYEAGAANTSGTNNTYVGTFCGDSVTTGGDNTYVGYQAGAGTTTGGANVAIGKGAFDVNTTGNNNVAIGQNALGASTGGGDLVAIGTAAGDTLTGGGNSVIIGSLADGSGINISNEIVIGYNSTGKGANTGFINPNGGAVYQGNNSTTWSQTSDIRIKKNITDNSDGLNKINNIQVRNFEYRTKDEIKELSPECAIQKEGVQLGVIAQEVRDILPEIVKEETTGCLKIDPDNLTWYLVNAVKELSTKIEELENNKCKCNEEK